MTTRSIRRAFILAWLSLACFAFPAESTTVVEVRVGPHPTFTRVVFELDAPAGYRVERHVVEAEGAAEIVITLEASSHARSISSRSKLVDMVSVDPGQGRAVARIRLRDPSLRLREMILRDPPRLVFDVMGEVAEVAAKPVARTQPTAAKPEAAEPLASETAKAPEPPKPKAAAVPKPQPTPRAPEPKLAVAEPVKPPAPAAEVVAKAPEKPPAAKPEPLRPTPKRPEAAPSPVKAVKDPEDVKPPKAAAEAPSTVARRLDEAKARRAESTPRPTAAPTPRRVAVEPERAPASSGLRSKLVAVGAVAAGALVVLVAVIVFVRRRSLPNDADVMLLADDEGEADPIPSEGFAMGESAMDDSQSELGESVEPVQAAATEDPFAASDDPFGEVGESTTEPEPGLSEEPDKGESAMDTETHDLTTPQDDLHAPPKFSGEEESDFARVVRELERRLVHVETRLDESIDARERLERQVAAQSEELRVQRAAIARTQRALRGLSRSEEEQATEPALREPGKPSFPGS